MISCNYKWNFSTNLIKDHGKCSIYAERQFCFELTSCDKNTVCILAILGLVPESLSLRCLCDFSHWQSYFRMSLNLVGWTKVLLTFDSMQLIHKIFSCIKIWFYSFILSYQVLLDTDHRWKKYYIENAQPTWQIITYQRLININKW